MKKIEFSSSHRKKHFDFFNGMNHPHFNITTNVDVSNLLPFLKQNNFPIGLSLVYLLSRVANAIKEFRWRIRGDEIIEHQSIQPSFSVPTDEADVFSFCTVPYEKDFNAFVSEAHRIAELMKTNPSFEDEEGRDDYLFMSAIPWVSFTSIQHAMNYHPHDCVPRISWGKFLEQEGKTLIPVAVQAHHALVDGRHVGKYFQILEKLINEPSKTFV